MNFRQKNHISGSFRMHACVLPLNIDQTEHTFLHPQGHVRKKMAKNHYANYTLSNMRHATADTS